MIVTEGIAPPSFRPIIITLETEEEAMLFKQLANVATEVIDASMKHADPSRPLLPRERAIAILNRLWSEGPFHKLKFYK